MARALRAAGLNINARSAWFADGLVRRARESARTECPAALPQAGESAHIEADERPS
jgi:hypothetical protein